MEVATFFNFWIPIKHTEQPCSKTKNSWIDYNENRQQDSPRNAKGRQVSTNHQQSKDRCGVNIRLGNRGATRWRVRSVTKAVWMRSLPVSQQTSANFFSLLCRFMHRRFVLPVHLSNLSLHLFPLSLLSLEFSPFHLMEALLASLWHTQIVSIATSLALRGHY